ncbi:sugar efflux transporter [Pelagicoccus enzymogenes]|uniref:sugar efflux transporter n=1 Tax=Pelagicoccus enzymogenes TaxID=2773457 RepID=UPI00280F6DC1|nr:sugar efflux transporter [Pelagicoccus enzymogenes]MDQ8198880.1 sugar efflux transporter [Pelagicoccus enzymogenes]
MPLLSSKHYLLALHRQPHFTGLLASTFALGTAFSFAVPFLSKWGLEAVGMSPRQFGLFMTATSLCAIFASTGLARLSDTRFSRRRMLLVGSLGGVSGFAGYALVRDPFILLLIGCSLHAVASICFAQLFSHVRESYQYSGDKQKTSSISLSVVRVTFSFSWTVGPALGATMLIAFGFRGLFLAASLLYALFLLGILRFVPEKKPARPDRSSPQTSLWKTLRHPRLLLSFLSFAAVFAANAINMMNLPLAITRSLNGKESDLGIVFAIGPVAEIPLMIWFGQLASRGHQLMLIKLGFLITSLYFAGLYLSSSPWHVYALQLLSGASFAILSNVAILYFQDLAPNQMGLATSLFSNAGATGNLLGMLSFGFLVEQWGNQGTFLACCAVASIGLALILSVKEPSSASQT